MKNFDLRKSGLDLLMEFSRLFIAIVFIYSGFVKAVDPLGSTYKFLDYFHDAFGIFALDWAAFPLSFLLAAAEFAIGMNLLFGVKVKITTIAAFAFMLIFTPLTLYLAIANPVHDCGCFGDALILSNWETFYKNIIIDVFLIIIYLFRNRYKKVFSCKWEWVFVGFAFLLSIGISFDGYKNLPMFDFRPYKIGAHINHGMLMPEDAVPPIYETSLLYTNSKTGEQKEFTLENMPEGEEWQWDSTINKLIQEGYSPPIHDFSIKSKDSDITDLVLADPMYNWLLVAWDLKTTDMDAFVKANEIAKFCREAGIGFRCLTSTSDQEVAEFVKELEKLVPEDTSAAAINTEAEKQVVFIYEREGEIMEVTIEDSEPDSSWTLATVDTIYIDPVIPSKVAIEFFGTDPITLKTIVRANPGLVLLRDGIIIGKWHYRHFPNVEDIKENHFMANAFEDYINNTGTLNNKIIYLLLLSVFLLYLSFIVYWRRR
ncbi:MAG: DoxX family protein [Bacteroidales bacterium]|nr:DoxX family protein [Bacteroidales bacterium]